MNNSNIVFAVFLLSIVNFTTQLPVRDPSARFVFNIEGRRDDNCVCGTSLTYRIVGGNETLPGEFPWQVSFGYDTQSRFCGGTLVTNNHIVSAAHCFHMRLDQTPMFRAFIGAHDFSRKELPFETHNLKLIKIHPRYCSKYEHYDISISTLETPVQFKRDILPPCFPPVAKNYDGSLATVIGWGLLYDEGPQSEILRKVEVPVRNNDLCIQNLYDYPMKSHQLCAFWEEGGKDACQGDSGSSLLFKNVNDSRWYFIGIVSYGWGCAEPAMPAMYTRVDSFYNWIEQNTPGGTFCTG